MTLRRQTTSAAFWQILARGADRGLRFLASLVLARVLAPADFGLLAATMVVAGVVETISYLGIDQAVVQSKRSDEPRFLGTAFRVLALRGLVIAIGTAVLAPLAAWYFEEPAVLKMVLIIALSPLLAGLENPWMFVERKNLRFKPISIATIAGACAQVATSVGGVYAGFGAPALALGCGSLARCAPLRVRRRALSLSLAALWHDLLTRLLTRTPLIRGRRRRAPRVQPSGCVLGWRWQAGAALFFDHAGPACS